MPFPSAPRTKGGKGTSKKKDSVAWAPATSLTTGGTGGGGGQHDEAPAEEKAPFSSNGMTTDGSSMFSSNNSGAAERVRTLDMDPEAVSHVR